LTTLVYVKVTSNKFEVRDLCLNASCFNFPNLCTSSWKFLGNMGLVAPRHKVV
jgi:hypothetical protein